MKKLVLVTLALLGGLAAQAADHKDVLLSNTRIASLKVNDNKLGLSISYPGKDFSKICGIEIRSDSNIQNGTIQNLLDAVRIVERFSQGKEIKVINSLTIDLDLSALNGSYGAWLTIETKDGSTLRQTIDRTLGEGRTVIAVTRTCQ